jgi:hypothetical protein
MARYVRQACVSPSDPTRYNRAVGKPINCGLTNRPLSNQTRAAALSARRRLERVASSTVIPPVYDDLMTLLDQDPGRHPTESVR